MAASTIFDHSYRSNFQLVARSDGKFHLLFDPESDHPTIVMRCDGSGWTLDEATNVADRLEFEAKRMQAAAN